MKMNILPLKTFLIDRKKISLRFELTKWFIKLQLEQLKIRRYWRLTVQIERNSIFQYVQIKTASENLQILSVLSY